MTLNDFTPNQLRRIYDNLYTRQLGHDTWDWHTLCQVYPSLAFAFRQIARIDKAKRAAA